MPWPAAAGALALGAAAFGCGGGNSSAGPAPTPTPTTGPEDVPALGYTRLAFNESPFGPFPGIFKPMAEVLARPFSMDAPDPDFLPGINRYPDFLNMGPTEWAALYYGVGFLNVVPTCGISELLYMCSEAFTGPGLHLLTPELTYLLPAHYALKTGREVRTAPMLGDHGIDLDALLSRITSETGLVYLANPNNPTGSLLAHSDLQTFVKQAAKKSPSTVIFIDEAYIDYVPENLVPNGLVLLDYQVVVGRTLSKAFGLAALRAGYGVANAEIIDTLNGVLGGYLGGPAGWRMSEGNVNRMAVAAMLSCLTADGRQFVNNVRDQNAALREKLFMGLESRGFSPIDSHANFLWVDVGSDGENCRRCLCSQNVMIQAGASFNPAYTNWVRISVGNDEQINALFHALERYDPAKTYPATFPVFYFGI